ncbi:MAG: lysophospholipid acyltransferase family protein [Bdellovibrionales bacterium]|nr:lysophospholipid acyltransferase family protein [Bdellovibrionales bacterium]
MTAVLYTLFVLPISRLPMRALYLLSDAFFVLIFYVLRYRRRVVEENLARSFPEKSAAERVVIARDFYRHFCDLIVESFKSFTISDAEIRARFRVANPEILVPFFEAGRSVVLAGGHYNNWEWLAVALRQQIPHRAVAIYKPLSNRFLEGKMRETRGKYGLEMLPMREVPAFFRAAAADPRTVPYAMIFGSDQSPGDPRKAHWMTFLGQDTGVTFGAEKYAKEYDLPIFFGVIRKVSRGKYLFELQPITDRPREAAPGALIEEVTRRLEAEIRQDPRYWLWTHRRWKHRRPADV